MGLSNCYVTLETRLRNTKTWKIQVKRVKNSKCNVTGKRKGGGDKAIYYEVLRRVGF